MKESRYEVLCICTVSARSGPQIGELGVHAREKLRPVAQHSDTRSLFPLPQPLLPLQICLPPFSKMTVRLALSALAASLVLQSTSAQYTATSVPPRRF